MRIWTIAIRSLGFYRWNNLGVVLTTIVVVAILTGALVVGDSLRYMLRSKVDARLGSTKFVVVSQNRFFRVELADELGAQLNTAVAPVLQVSGLLSNGSGTRCVNNVQVLGVDGRFFEIGGNQKSKTQVLSLVGGEIVINEPVSARLVRPGGSDEVVLRIAKPSLLSRDVPIMPDSGLTVASRLRVTAIAGRDKFGSFSLNANSGVPLNVFVPIQWLQERLGLTAKANILLIADGINGQKVTTELVGRAIKISWKIEDAGLELRQLSGRTDCLEMRSGRIFISDSTANAAMAITDNAIGVLTYFVNKLRCGDRSVPYSMVAAMSRAHDLIGDDPYSPIPMDMQDDEILINQWLAEELSAKVGDSIELTFFEIGPNRKLQEQKAGFKVRGILPMDNPAMDRQLMPDFPGLADVNNCRDWDTGIAIDLNRISKRDEDYWNRYRGTPKAFVTLTAGQKLWANRYGKLTAIRYRLGNANSYALDPAINRGAKFSPPIYWRVAEKTITEQLRKIIEPCSVGLFVQPVREQGMLAADSGTDFGQLFVGLSMFLIAAAIILLGLVFAFGVESRSEQIGILQAIGFSARLVRRLFWAEGAVLAGLGAIAGITIGLIYTKALLYILALLAPGRGMAEAQGLVLHAEPFTLLTGGVAGMVICVAAIAVSLRKQTRRVARELLYGNLEQQWSNRISNTKCRISKLPRLWFILAAILFFIGSGIIFFAGNTSQSGQSVSAVFFAAGTLLLIAGLCLTGGLLRVLNFKLKILTFTGLGLRNSTRRSGRSLAIVGMFACGVFIVIAIGANRPPDVAALSSTGGFSFYGESTVPVLYDLNGDKGRISLGLNTEEVRGVEIVQARVHDGDDASCLNLNRAQRPRLLGVQPEKLQRSAFAFRKTIKSVNPRLDWGLLNLATDDDAAPAVGDYPTIVWALGKSVGDELEYVDEMGRPFRLRLVGMLESSILQGSLLISESNFIRRFGSEEGYRLFLINAPSDDVEKVGEFLSKRLSDFGLSLTPARQRMAEFGAVENMYLSIFQLLGGLGLILGTVGLGLVVLRNMLERRGELAMLRAVGFDKGSIGRMVFYEHWLLCLWGLFCGVTSALPAVAPAIKSPNSQLPYFSLLLMVGLIAVSSLVWIRLAVALTLRGRLLDALRNE